MSKPRYIPPTPITREALEKVLQAGITDQICQAMVDATYSPVDPIWLQQKCIELSVSEDVWLRRIACIVIGHVGRMLDGNILPEAGVTLDRLVLEPGTHGEASDAIEDIALAKRRA